jgi:hypothetical protein
MEVERLDKSIEQKIEVWWIFQPARCVILHLPSGGIRMDHGISNGVY